MFFLAKQFKTDGFYFLLQVCLQSLFKPEHFNFFLNVPKYISLYESSNSKEKTKGYDMLSFVATSLYIHSHHSLFRQYSSLQIWVLLVYPKKINVTCEMKIHPGNTIYSSTTGVAVHRDASLKFSTYLCLFRDLIIINHSE